MQLKNLPTKNYKKQNIIGCEAGKCIPILIMSEREGKKMNIN